MPRWRNGRRARFRCACREACRFDSCSGHKERLVTIVASLILFDVNSVTNHDFPVPFDVKTPVRFRDLAATEVVQGRFIVLCPLFMN